MVLKQNRSSCCVPCFCSSAMTKIRKLSLLKLLLLARLFWLMHHRMISTSQEKDFVWGEDQVFNAQMSLVRKGFDIFQCKKAQLPHEIPFNMCWLCVLAWQRNIQVFHAAISCQAISLPSNRLLAFPRALTWTCYNWRSIILRSCCVGSFNWKTAATFWKP